jgi:hypothetical protein
MERPEVITRHGFQIDLLHRYSTALHFSFRRLRDILPGKLLRKWSWLRLSAAVCTPSKSGCFPWGHQRKLAFAFAQSRHGSIMIAIQ